MSRDGLLPPVASRIHPKYHTPHVSTILVGVVVTALAGLLPIGIVAELLSIGTLMAFVIVCIGVLALRIMQPKLDRPFRAPAILPLRLWARCRPSVSCLACRRR